MNMMGGVKSLGVSLAYLGAYIGIVASRHVCFIGTVYSKDVGSLRWVLPYEDPCVCTAIRPGGHMPYKPATGHYLEGLFLSENSCEIRKFFDCQAVCDEPSYLGVGVWGSHSGVTPLTIHDDKFSSSSNDEDGKYQCKASSARLNFEGDSVHRIAGWKPSDSNKNEWVSVRLGRNVLVSGIITQGRGDDGSGKQYWVTKYKVEYSTSENIEHYVEMKYPGGNSMVFNGNTAAYNTKVTNYFLEPVRAYSVRIYPVAWENQIVLRFELLGCLIKS